MTRSHGWSPTAPMVVVTVASALFGLPEGLAAQATASSVAEGANVYGATCGRCHNPRSPLERTDREWSVIINHMRVRGNLTGDQVRNVLTFLQSLNTDPRTAVPELTAPPLTAAPAPSADPPSNDPELIETGRALVTQKACIGCHLIGGAGGQIGPALAGVIDRRGARFVRSKLADPTVDNASSAMPNLGLSADEIEALLAYLATLR